MTEFIDGHFQYDKTSVPSWPRVLLGPDLLITKSRSVLGYSETGL